MKCQERGEGFKKDPVVLTRGQDEKEKGNRGTLIREMWGRGFLAGGGTKEYNKGVWGWTLQGAEEEKKQLKREQI